MLAQSSSDDISATFKLFSVILTTTFCLIVLGLTTAYLLKTRHRFLPNGLTPIATINYTHSASPTFGTNLIPLLNLPTQVGSHQANYEFLLDSGAVVSTLPLLNQNIIDPLTLKRVILESATDHVTFGYITDMNIRLNQTTITIPVAISDIPIPVLGRHGFFDRYTMIFDHQLEAVTIAQTL